MSLTFLAFATKQNSIKIMIFMEIKMIYNIGLFSTYAKSPSVFFNLITRQLKAVDKTDYIHNLLNYNSRV